MIDPKRIWSSTQLPSLPTVAVRLLELAGQPETEIKLVVDTIKTDPALTAKILKSANSTFFGLTTRVTSVDRAVPLLGTTVVTSLALSFSLADAAMGSGASAAHFRRYWRQSLIQGIAAETLASHLNQVMTTEWFLAGLLMDLGKLAMLKTVSKEYIPALERADAEEAELATVEKEMLGVDHVEVGLRLMANWSLPEFIIEAGRHHHEPAAEFAHYAGNPAFPLIVSLAAAASIGDYFCAAGKGLPLRRLNELAAEHLQMNADQVQEFIGKINTRLEATADLFSFNMEEIGDPADLMAKANEQLAKLAMQEHAAHTQAAANQTRVEQEKRELESKHAELQKEALQDPLTGVYNRRFLETCASKAASQAARSASPFGLIILDIDKFKSINDTYGHPFGDVVLQKVAHAIQQTIRSADTMARFGGEEFVILVSDPTERGLMRLAERCRQSVEQLVVTFEGKNVPVTISLGAAITIPPRTSPNCTAEVLAAADKGLYESKQNGRNRVTFVNMMSEHDQKLLALMNPLKFSRWLVAQGKIDVANVTKALARLPRDTARTGELAVRMKLLRDDDVAVIMADQTQRNARFGEAAVADGKLTLEQLAAVLTAQQENPLRLAELLKEMNLMAPSAVDDALTQFGREFSVFAPLVARTPQPAAV